MEFKVGHLVFAKDVMLRVIGNGANHIDVIEYKDALAFGGDLVTKTYSKIDGTWYRWDVNGGKPIKLKKIGLISPTKTPHMVKDFSQIQGFDTMIIKGVPHKPAQNTSLPVPDHWKKVYYLRSRSGEAVMHIQAKKRETLYDRGAEAQLLTSSGVISLKETDVWTIIKN